MVSEQASETTADLRLILDESTRVADANARSLPVLSTQLSQGMPPRARQQFEAEHRRLQALPPSPELPLQVRQHTIVLSPLSSQYKP